MWNESNVRVFGTKGDEKDNDQCTLCVYVVLTVISAYVWRKAMQCGESLPDMVTQRTYK